MNTTASICSTPQNLYSGYFCYSPLQGGKLTKLVINKNGKLFSVLKELDEKSLMEPAEMFTNAILVPFPNRLRNGTYRVDGQEYHLEPYPKIAPHAVHGFMYNRPVDSVVEEFTDGSAKVLLKTIYRNDVQGYPFEFEQTITYEISAEACFSCKVSVENIGTQTMPIGIGMHPYFKFDRAIDEVFLKLPACQRIETDADCFPIGDVNNYPDFQIPLLIQEQKFNDCFLAAPEQDLVEIRLIAGDHQLIYTQYYSASKYFQLYIPPDRQSIAIEPMTCSIDAFNNQQGLTHLKPNEICTCSYRVQISSDFQQ